MAAGPRAVTTTLPSTVTNPTTLEIITISLGAETIPARAATITCEGRSEHFSKSHDKGPRVMRTAPRVTTILAGDAMTAPATLKTETVTLYYPSHADISTLVRTPLYGTDSSPLHGPTHRQGSSTGHMGFYKALSKA